MEDSVAEALLALNRQFYQTFADPFSATRGRLQPGVLRVLETLPGGARVLDLGCGNGELWRELARRDHRGTYTGLDSSAELLEQARRGVRRGLTVMLHQIDLADPDWETDLSGAPFDVILAFAVLHHLPGAPLRARLLRKARRLLTPDGKFIHSEWQFLNSARLRARLQPWEKVGLTDADVDPGDHLLDWRRGGHGLRYVHHFTLEELASLAAETGFEIHETFLSDGAGGDLGLYQVWGLHLR